MRLRGAVAAMCAGALLLLTPAAAYAAGPYPPPADEHAEVDDTRVEAGECVIFSGGGFEPGTEVTIRDNGKVVGTTRADDRGEFRFEVCFEVDAKPGRHTLAVTGLGADGQPLTLTATVFVTGRSERPGPGTGPGRGGGSGGEGAGPAATAEPSASVSPSASPASAPTPSTTPSAVSEPRPPRAGAETSDGLGLMSWLAFLFAFLGLLAGLLLLAARRRRDEDDPVAPA